MNWYAFSAVIGFLVSAAAVMLFMIWLTQFYDVVWIIAAFLIVITFIAATIAGRATR